MSIGKAVSAVTLPRANAMALIAARGELRKNSDIDLLSVVADAPPDRPREIRKSP